MQLKSITRSLFVGISILTLTSVGCTQLRNFESETQNPTANSQTNADSDQAQAAPNPTTETPTRAPDVGCC